jgi:uncharacterized metal-binding protein
MEVVKADRTPTSPPVIRPVIVVAGCSPRVVERCTQAAEAVRCDVYAVTLAELGAAAFTHGPLVIVMPTVEYWAKRAEHDVRAEDVKASIVPVANDRVDQDELEGLFMAAVAEAQRRRAEP